MNKATKIIVGIVIIVVIVVLVVVFSGKEQEKGIIKIGFACPLTGEVASAGEVIKNGIDLAVEEINSRGGIDGKKIEVIYEDGKCDGKEAATAAQKLINIDKVKIVVACCSGEVLAIAPISEPTKVILFSPSGSNPKIAEAGEYIFRNHPDDNAAGSELARLIYKEYKKTAIITESTEYTEGLKTTFIESYTSLGGEIVFNESFSPGTKDFRSILIKMKDKSPEAIFINTQSDPPAILVAKQARELGLNQQFYGAYLTGGDYVKAGDFTEGTIIIDTPGLESDRSATIAFLKAYEDRYGEEPQAYPYFSGAAYDTIYILTQTIKKHGENTDKIKGYLYELPSYSGVIGDYRFNEKGDVVGIKFSIKTVRNGQIVPYE